MPNICAIYNHAENNVLKSSLNACMSTIFNHSTNHPTNCFIIFAQSHLKNGHFFVLLYYDLLRLYINICAFKLALNNSIKYMNVISQITLRQLFHFLKDYFTWKVTVTEKQGQTETTSVCWLSFNLKENKIHPVYLIIWHDPPTG